MKKTIIILLAAFASLTIHAQQFAVKTDVAWDALMIPNIGADFVVGDRSTVGVDIFGCKKIWNKNIQGYGIQPEYRYYFSGRAMHQHYIGIGGMALTYKQTFSDTRHDDVYAVGTGLLFGYVMHIGQRWNIDFHAGCGIYLFHDKKNLYNAKKDNWDDSETNKGFFPAPTSLGISVSYIIK